MPHIGYVTLLVRDYDEALRFYTESLGFNLVEDTPLANSTRWLLVAPPGSTETSILLAKASTPDQAARIGDQAGGRVALFLHTDDFWRDYDRMQANGVIFMEKPRSEPYGTVAVFCDLYGNRWDLLQLNR
jgi:catechol 2,3-dioxygenase-like lactoylglutathione lyase family enzyme